MVTRRLVWGPFALATVLLLGVLAPGCVAPITFGSALDAPNTTFGCGVAPTVTGFVSTGATQCVWSEVASGSTSSVGSDMIPAGNGTVTTAKVRVGATTGPMRFVMIRALVNVDNLNVSCCVVLLESNTFTPTKNAVTSQTVNFPIVANNSIVDGNLEIVDVLGLLVLNATTPIPLTSKTSLPLNQQPADEALFGPITLGTAQLFFDPLGYQLDISGSFTPS